MSYKKDNILEVFDTLELEDTQKKVIKMRYGSELGSLYRKANRSTCTYMWTTIVSSTLGVLLPGILSIQKSSDSLETPIYWTSWAISLILTLLQGYSKLFKIDRNYYFYNFNYERFISEGWNYIHLGGRYNTKDTHKGAYKRFMRNIERMKLENVSLEFTDVKDSDEVTKKKKKKDGTTPLVGENNLEYSSLRGSGTPSINNDNNEFSNHNNIEDNIEDRNINNIKDSNINII
tara:strand:- start:217 stop:915 length:699 start_codon:yes stop_codon:yes gene_type:complete